MEAPLFRAGSSHGKELLNRLEPYEMQDEVPENSSSAIETSALR